MHASIWSFGGDPDDLLRRYDAMVETLPPSSPMHLCLRTSERIMLVDTCPSREAFREFAEGNAFRALRERFGLPEPDRLDDYAVHVALVGGRPIRR